MKLSEYITMVLDSTPLQAQIEFTVNLDDKGNVNAHGANIVKFSLFKGDK